MKVNLIIKDDIAKKFMKFLKLTTGANVIRIALVILLWVIDESKKGRIIYSVDADGENKKELVFPWIGKNR